MRRSGVIAMLRYALVLLCALCAALLALPASAQPRVWLDRDRIALDETVMLSIEMDITRTPGLPNIVDLSRDFRVVDQQVQNQVAWANGALTALLTMQVTLAPLREGQIEIGSLWSGRDATAPLRLTVLPPRYPQDAPEPAPVAAAQGQPIFIETQSSTQTPYVQQTVGYTLRLYYLSGSMVDGRLDQDLPKGANLQKVGDDLNTKARIGDQDYTVVERRYLLIPERSGTLTVPPARFLGRSLGLFDSIFDTNRPELRLASDPIAMRVKPIPAAAVQPWLPLGGLRMRYLEAPQSMRVGESATIVVEMVADGAIAAQLPALTLQAGKDAQVFAEPPQVDDRFQQGQPQANIIRRFSILPTREGTLRISALRIDWWDTQAGIARVASLPDLSIPVAPGAAGTAAPPKSPGADTAANALSNGWRSWMPNGRWLWTGLALLLLWVGALAFAWRLWATRGKPDPVVAPASAASAQVHAPLSRADAQTLTLALTRGNVSDIARTLCAMSTPVATDLDAVRARLADPAQRAAVDALQRTRWGDGDTAPTLAALRAAFASGPRWRTPTVHAKPVLLPPLYPER